jgi:hypothetical protein
VTNEPPASSVAVPFKVRAVPPTGPAVEKMVAIARAVAIVIPPPATVTVGGPLVVGHQASLFTVYEALVLANASTPNVE